jgi:hypothetical protein
VDSLSKTLLRFSQVEADSGWQLLQVLPQLENARSRAHFFHNALEEEHHAWLFAQLAQRYARFPLPLQRDGRLSLYVPGEDLDQFRAYHAVAEKQAYDDFVAYAAAIRDPRVRDVFERIREDEEGHHEGAIDAWAAAGEARGRVRSLLRRARIRRYYEAWLRGSRRLAALTSGLVLAFLYLAAGPFLAIPCRRRLRIAPGA